MDKKNSDLRPLRIFVLVLGTALALFFLLVFVPKLISSVIGDAPQAATGREWEGHVMTAMFLVFMFGYALGWFRILWGGIIIILAAFTVCAPFIIIQANYGSLIFGIPQFVIGLSYVILYLLEKYVGKRGVRTK